jgi:hypothetical protein
MASTIHEEGLLKKLSRGMMGKKWQERHVILDETGLRQRKPNESNKVAKYCVQASQIGNVELKQANDGVEICILQIGGGVYVLKARSNDVAQAWAGNIKRVSPAGVAQAKADSDRRVAEAKAKAEMEAKSKAEAEKAKAEAEAKAQAEAEAKEAETKAQAEAEAEVVEKARQEAENQLERIDEESTEESTAEDTLQQTSENADTMSIDEENDATEMELQDKWAGDASAGDDIPEEEADATDGTGGSMQEDEDKEEEDAEAQPPTDEVSNSKVSKPTKVSNKRAASPPPAPPSSGSGSVFDRLATSYTGTSKHRRKAVNTKHSGFRGMDGHVSRSAGTGDGGRSWLDVGLDETRSMDYDVYNHKRIGTDAVGGCMSKLSVNRFQAITSEGHYRSNKDLEESAQRDIECVDKSTFTKFASTRSQFGTHMCMGMGGSAGNRFASSVTSSGHYYSNKDLEEAAKRDYLEDGSIHTSTFHSTKPVTTRQGMAMGGSVGRFQLVTPSGHIYSEKDNEEAAKRDIGLSVESDALTSTFASAMKRGNPSFDFMGGKSGRFAANDPNSFFAKPLTEKGPGDYTGPTTTFNLLPMPPKAEAAAPTKAADAEAVDP